MSCSYTSKRLLIFLPLFKILILASLFCTCFNSICDLTSFLEGHRVYVINTIITFNKSRAAKRSRKLLPRSSLQLGRLCFTVFPRS